jgi:hypothetical protein
MRGSFATMSDEERRELRERPRSGAAVFAGIADDVGAVFSPDGLVMNDDEVMARLVADGWSASEAPGRVAELEAWGQFAAAKTRLLSIEMPDELRETIEDLIWLVDRRGTAAYGLAAHRHNEARAQAEQAYKESSASKAVFEDGMELVGFLLREKGIEVVGDERWERLTRPRGEVWEDVDPPPMTAEAR